MEKDCDCETCQRMKDLVTEIGEVIDGHSVKDVIFSFAHILSSIGENLPVGRREFATEFYVTLKKIVEDDDNGNRTYN